jgi:hypothetical protein
VSLHQSRVRCKRQLVKPLNPKPLPLSSLSPASQKFLNLLFCLLAVTSAGLRMTRKFIVPFVRFAVCVLCKSQALRSSITRACCAGAAQPNRQKVVMLARPTANDSVRKL